MFNEIELFAVLVCVFRKESTEIAEFDPLYLENYFEFLKAVKNNW